MRNAARILRRTGKFGPVRRPVAAVMFLAVALGPWEGRAGHYEQDSASNTANAVIVDRLMLAKFSDIDIAGAGLSDAGEHTTIELRPTGRLKRDGTAGREADASFTAVFSLAGTPYQTFGISLPGAMVLSSGAQSHSVRAFLHDAGPVPVLSEGGTGRFNVGAVLSVGRTDARNTEVYIGEIYVIVSNN